MLKQSQDAARLYEEGDAPKKAAKIYIRTKNWTAAAPLMSRIVAPKLHAEYAKVRTDISIYVRVCLYISKSTSATKDWTTAISIYLSISISIYK